MSKRVRITAIVATLCVCLSLFVVGVLSATTATLNVTSTLTFVSNGAYVMVDGELRQGETAETATLQSGAPTSYTYKGYSYNCIGGNGADKDKPDGSESLSNFVDASGGANDPWAIGDINFTSSLPVAVYHFTFTNYSELMVLVSVDSNIQELNTELAEKVKITENFESSNTIEGYDGTTAKSITYTITVEIEDYTTSFEDKQLELTIQFDTLELNRDYFNYDDNYSYIAITGLSEKYFEDKPSVLIVPGYAENGKVLRITNGSYSEPVFNGLVSSTVIIQDGLTSIGSYAFYNCYYLSSITLPNSVTNIGSYAFRGCSSLTSIIIPEKVTRIEHDTFGGCISLTSITLPSGLTDIGRSSFYDCKSLTSINIPANVTNIDDYAFSGCGNLQITVEEGNAEYLSIDGSLYDKTETTLVRGVGGKSSVNLLDSVTNISPGAFSGCSSLISINIPKGVTSIGDSAFNDCHSLTSVNIPKGVTSIGYMLFYNCFSLSNLILPASVTNIDDYAFFSCSSLISINIPEGVTSIGSTAFRDCRSLTSITIPEGVTNIEDMSFYGCSSLTSVTLPSSLTSIGSSGFQYSYSIVEIYNYSDLNIDGSSSVGYLGGSSTLAIYNLEAGAEKPASKLSVEGTVQYYADGTDIIAVATYGNRNAINELTFKEETTKINKYAFSSCYNLTSVTLPSSLTDIGSRAFEYCYSLAEVYNKSTLNLNIIANSFVDHYAYIVHTTDEPTRIIKENGMQYYENDDGTFIALSPINRATVKEVKLKEGTTKITPYAFKDCYNLNSVIISDGVTSIGEYAFSGCDSLIIVTIPGSVTQIDTYAFQGCDYLTIDMTKVIWNDLNFGNYVFQHNYSAGVMTILVSDTAEITKVQELINSVQIGGTIGTNLIKQGTKIYKWDGINNVWV